MRAASAAAAKALGASEAPFCKACRNMEIGKQNREAHLSATVYLGEEGALAQEEARTETPAAAASGTMGDVSESEAKLSPAVTCSALWD